MISAISIFLDIFNYKYINNNSLFLSLFTISSLLFIKRDKNYFLKLVFLGLIYDLIFTNYILDPFIFIIIGLIIKFFYSFLEEGIINNIFILLIVLLFYIIILTIFLNVFKINIIDFNNILLILRHFVLINIIYVIIVSIIKYK